MSGEQSENCVNKVAATNYFKVQIVIANVEQTLKQNYKKWSLTDIDCNESKCSTIDQSLLWIKHSLDGKKNWNENCCCCFSFFLQIIGPFKLFCIQHQGVFFFSLNFFSEINKFLVCSICRSRKCSTEILVNVRYYHYYLYQQQCFGTEKELLRNHWWEK